MSMRNATIKYKNWGSPYNPDKVRVLYRFTKEDLEELIEQTKNKSIPVRIFLNNEEKEVRFEEFCTLALKKAFTEKDIKLTADRFLSTSKILRVLAYMLDEKDALVAEPPCIKDNYDESFFIADRPYANILDKSTVMQDLLSDKEAFPLIVF